MSKSAYLIVAALAFVFLQPSAALNATTANSVCNLLENGTSIFSGETCDQYYTCSGGVATLATCPSGDYYSKDSQNCLPQAQVTCSVGANPCATATNGLFVAVADSCTEYYYCSNGVGTLGTCPDGMNFDAADQSCNYTSDYACSTTNDGTNSSSINLCAVIPNGVFFASSTSCQAWQECNNGALTTGVCNSPYYFNVETASCDYQDDVSCRQVTGDPSTGTDPDYLAGKPCTQNGTIVSDNSTCTGYYSCNSGVYSYGTCSNGLYFNPSTSDCVNRVNATNNCNRCEGTTLEFVNLYQDNCVGYGYCQNGRVSSSASCGTGYFNEIYQACVASTEPNFLVCNVDLYEASLNSTAAATTTLAPTTL